MKGQGEPDRSHNLSLFPWCLRGVALAMTLAAVLCAARMSAQVSETLLYTFAGPRQDGQSPQGGLVRDTQGNFYGTTDAGGHYGMGTIYRLTPPQKSGGEWVTEILYTFAPGDGANPEWGALVMDASGSLYGTTQYGGIRGCGNGFGCGTIFRLSPPAGGSGPWTLTNLYGLHGLGDGAYPNAGLIFDSDGNLYGTAAAGGSKHGNCYPYGCGVVFELSPPAGEAGNWKYQVLHRFQGADGLVPFCTLSRDNGGVLYGTASEGGKYGAGVVFKLVPEGSKWQEKVLWNFTGGNDGWQPVSGVVAHDGALYGVTTSGGDFSWGNVYQLTPNGGATWTENTLYSFTGGSDSGTPLSDLTFAQDGTLYGTAEYGFEGNCPFGGCGNVFKMTPGSGNTWSYQTVYTFQGEPDGFLPSGRLFVSPSGIIYGVTSGGGAGCVNGCGTIYQITQ